MPSKINKKQTSADDIVSVLYGQIMNHLDMLEDISYYKNTAKLPKDRSCINFIDAEIFIHNYKMAFNIATSQADSLEYLKSKNISSYGDLLEMHQSILQTISNNDEKHLAYMELALIYDLGDDAPRTLRGPGRLFLNTLDFLPAIPWIPHSPNPEQPTIMGLMLSSAQAVLRDERFYSSRTMVTHHDLMHLLVASGTFLSAYARTTTGQPISKNYPLIDDSNAKPANFIFDDFTVTNAIPFHPEYVLITGHPRIILDSDSCKEKVQLIYNTLESGKAMFIPSTSTSGNELDQFYGKVESRFTPEFMRTIIRNFTS